MERRHVAICVGAIVVALFSVFPATAFNANVRYTDVTVNVWIKNPTNQIINNSAFEIAEYQNFPLNLTADWNAIGGAVNTTFSKDGKSVDISFDKLGPNQTLMLSADGISNRFPIESRHYNQSDPIYVTGYRSVLVPSTATQFYAKTPFGRIEAESTYYFLKGPTPDFELRVFTSDYVFVAFCSIGLLLYGVVLRLTRLLSARKYPFVTIGIVALNSWTYAFIGTGWEVNLLPTFLIFRYFLLSFAFHGSFSHITGNMPYFVIASLLLEMWIGVKTNWRRATWYFLPFLGAWIWSLNFNQGIGFSFGLSTYIELLTVALWTQIIDNWKWASARRRNILLVLLAGIPFYVYFGWVYNLTLQVPFAVYTNAFDLNEAQYHVTIGTIGLAVAVIFLARNLIDRGLKRIGLSQIARRLNPSWRGRHPATLKARLMPSPAVFLGPLPMAMRMPRLQSTRSS